MYLKKDIVIIPKIYLRNGKCPFCIKGETGTEKMYDRFSENPQNLCGLLRRENARTMLLIDTDSFFGLDNTENINTIISVLNDENNIVVPIKVYSDFKSVDECNYLFEKGVIRIVIDRLLLLDFKGVKDFIEERGDTSVNFYVFSDEGVVKFGSEEIKTEEYLGTIYEAGGRRIMYGEASWENNGPDYDTLRKIKEKYDFAITLANGINNSRELIRLQKIENCSIDSFLIGDALYHNNFPCQKIWRLIESEIEE